MTVSAIIVSEDKNIMLVKCLVELEFENDNDKVSWTDSHDLEKLLYDNGFKVSKISLVPGDAVKTITYLDSK